MSPEFNFFQHWYPLSPIEDLDPKRPTPVTVLGLRLVIWKPGSSGTYRVFLDQCPHRLAPLSEGRVDEKTGNLMCSYHGWQFDEQGLCTHIPQAENPQLVAKNQQNFCAAALPCCQENDLLWVWLDAKSAELAAVTPRPLSPQVDASKGFVWSSMVRDLDYDWQTLVENLADPSHVSFAHHGVQGDREKAMPIPLEITQSTSNRIEATTVGRFKTKITFEPPCHLEYAIGFGDKGQQLGLITYCIPVAPGKSRIVAQFPRNFAKTLHELTPRWWNHIKIRNQVLDGDMILLHQQEHFLQQRQPDESWKTVYKLPTSADRLVIEWRKWFDVYCQGKLPWNEVGLSRSEKTTIDDSRQELLNRYKQHTQHCSSCRGALKTLQRLQMVLLVNFILTISGVAVMPDSLRLSLGLPLMAVALLGLGAFAWLKFWLEPRFYFIDYVHADR
ncbi:MULTISPECIES: Rieske 2Fe-2S domain-containing protein [unclassified Coleofasciculus]|uniref:aromatic ring-hydroxylating dioxygenase subunit alpha n=1 Tax=unclassified Coleofasciculus TaxID=2692782 RepID=UPI001881D9D9|nr:MULTISPECIES: Rieske 2Fe-2S domain-containing protein [unclassified Coleofasciculus]MBE9129787.1 Rieske 2Fe-2S domain-containing protein [Coleofasciculus sp. LEGE 07081]MBE9152247.1 Rieske 2Fe-2S domain-containing protein [Coleofasciculus sp. LEGE 07092]